MFRTGGLVRWELWCCYLASEFRVVSQMLDSRRVDVWEVWLPLHKSHSLSSSCTYHWANFPVEFVFNLPLPQSPHRVSGTCCLRSRLVVLGISFDDDDDTEVVLGVGIRGICWKCFWCHNLHHKEGLSEWLCLCITSSSFNDLSKTFIAFKCYCYIFSWSYAGSWCLSLNFCESSTQSLSHCLQI